MQGKWIVGLLVLAVGVGTLGESRVRIVRISFLARGVEVSRPADPAAGATPDVARWEPALLNAPVIEAEKIRTLAAGEVEVQLECGSALRLTPNSEFSFTKLRLEDDGVRATEVAVGDGTAFFSVRRADSQDFRVEVPGGEVETPEGAASFRVEAPANAAATVELIGGRAQVVVGKRAYELKRDAKLDLPSTGLPIFEADAAPDRWALWSRDRDRIFQREVSADESKPAVDAARAEPPPTAISEPPSSVDVERNPAGVFAEMDTSAGMTSDDSFFTPKSGAKKAPYCANN